MRNWPIVFDAVESESALWDRLIDALLVLLFVVTLLALGAPAIGNFSASSDLRNVPWFWRDVLYPYGESAFIALATAMLVALLLKLLLVRSFRLAWSWSYVPIAAFLLLGLLQSVELPRPMVSALAPTSLSMRDELLADLSTEKPSLVSLGVYPEATRQNLRVLVAVVAIFFVVLNNYRKSWQMHRLLVAMVLVGGTVAVIALLQPWLAKGRLLWLIPTSFSLRGGPFVNPNNFAQFANLTLGASIALLLYRLRRVLPGRDYTMQEVKERFSDPRLRDGWMGAIVALLSALAVALSLSRAGTLSLIVGMLIACAVVARKPGIPGRSWALTGIGMAVFLAALLLGAEALMKRLGTLRDVDTFERSRGAMIASAASSWKDFPLVGSGLGSFYVVFPMYDRTANPLLAENADSDWTQLVGESGVLGTSAALAFVALVFAAWVRSLRGRAGSGTSIAVGLGVGWVAVVIHSGFDLGQHLPGVAMFTACTSAMLLNMPGQNLQRDRDENASSRLLSRRVGGALATLLTVGAVVATWDGIDAARAEASFIRAYAVEQRMRNLDWQGTDAEYRQMVFAARAASDRRPGNVHYAFWENVYQLKYLESGRDTGDGPVQLLRSELVLLRDRMDRVRRIAPTFGPAHSVSGEIRLRYLDDPVGGKLIRQGRRLSRSDPTSILLAAELSLQEKDYAAAIDDFRALSEINEGYRVEGVMLLLKAGQVDAALQLAEGSVTASGRLYSELQRVGPVEATQRARAQLRRELQRRSDEGQASGEALATLAQMLAEDGEHERSIEVMRRALRRNVANSEWRLQVVRSLLELGRDLDALDEVQNVLRSDPRNRQAAELLTRIEERLRRSRSSTTTSSE